MRTSWYPFALLPSTSSPRLILASAFNAICFILCPPNCILYTLYLLYLFYFIYLFCSFASHYFYFYFAHSSIANLPFQCFTCYIVFTLPPWPFFAFTSLLTSFAHIVYRLVYTVLFTVCFTPCVTVSLFVSNCFALSWPGRNCK